MTAPNMATITASLERSLQNFSLNHDDGGGGAGVIGRSATSDATDNLTINADTTVELNSHVALPYQWEQCLDLKTGEIYYIDWRNGTKEREDPRKALRSAAGGYYSDVDDDEDDDDDQEEEDSSCESEGSCTDSCPSTARDDCHRQDVGNHVLVVAGCKRCLMYFMVPKEVEECPKCSGMLLHFDRTDSE